MNEWVNSIAEMILIGKPTDWEKNLYQFHHIWHKSHTPQPGTKIGASWYKAGDNPIDNDNLLLLNNLLSFLQEQSNSVWCGFLLKFIIKEFSSEIICLDNKCKWRHKQTPIVGSSDTVHYKMNKFYPVSIYECNLSVLYELQAPTTLSNDTPTQNCSSKRTTVVTYALKLMHIYQVKQGPDSRNFFIRVQKPT
jgi:hypothetical protein